MTITTPGWYRGGFPERTMVTINLLQPFLSLTAPAGIAVSWLPSDYDDVITASGGYYVRVFRAGGGATPHPIFDPAAVQVAVIGESIEDSWAMLEYCRQMLLSYEFGGTVYNADGSFFAEVQCIEEMVGPVEFPEMNPDLRLVPATFHIDCRRPRGLPDYRVIRESLTPPL